MKENSVCKKNVRKIAEKKVCVRWEVLVNVIRGILDPAVSIKHVNIIAMVMDCAIMGFVFVKKDSMELSVRKLIH